MSNLRLIARFLGSFRRWWLDKYNDEQMEYVINQDDPYLPIVKLFATHFMGIGEKESNIAENQFCKIIIVTSGNL